MVLEMNEDAKIKVVGNYSPSNHEASRIVDSEGIAPAVKENHGTVNAVEVRTTRGKEVVSTIRASIYKQGTRNIEENVRSGLGYEGVMEVNRQPLKFLNRNQKNIEGDYAYTIDTCHTGGIREVYESEKVRIRKLTPKECWRLMGFDDADFEKAERECSNCQLYKQAGNSIVVPVIEAIYKQLGWCENE